MLQYVNIYFVQYSKVNSLGSIVPLQFTHTTDSVMFARRVAGPAAIGRDDMKRPRPGGKLHGKTCTAFIFILR